MGISGILENKLRGQWVEAIREKYSIDSEQEETYTTPQTRRNDFTLLYPGERIFNEFKISAVPMGKLSRISDDAIKLKKAKPPYGLLILALSATDELQTDERVEDKANVTGANWSHAFKKTIADRGLGELMGRDLCRARLYWFVKDARS